jgi:hypothetical protein
MKKLRENKEDERKMERSKYTCSQLPISLCSFPFPELTNRCEI